MPSKARVSSRFLSAMGGKPRELKDLLSLWSARNLLTPSSLPILPGHSGCAVWGLVY